MKKENPNPLRHLDNGNLLPLSFSGTHRKTKAPTSRRTPTIAAVLFSLLTTCLRAELDLTSLTKAIPETPSATPERQRRLLVYYIKDDVKIIQLANALFSQMGKKTGAFEAVVSNDSRMFETDRLNVFDAVLFNNTANIERYILKREYRENLLKFVDEGGGVIGIHQALNGGFNLKHQDTELNWPAYSQLLGAKFDNHSWSPNGTWPVAVEDAEHPINAAFADLYHESKGIRFVGTFRIQDELRRFRDFSRKESRVLLKVDNRLNNSNGPQDNPVAWIRQQGKGRVFYSYFGSNESTYSNPLIVKHWLDGIQFALSDLKADATPVPNPPAPQTVFNDPPAPYHKPEETLKMLQLPEGFKAEVMVGEEDIHEPVVVAWDANGRMYVAEMRTYMQEIDGKDQMRPISRVSMHEDSDGDGTMDRHTVFADNLVLPRMVLPLDDRIVIGETDTSTLHAYRDTDGDGQADVKEVWYEGGNRGGNLEHQASGLIWCLDNWIYLSKDNVRFRFTSGKVVKEDSRMTGAQWGLTSDDMGRVFYSTNSNPGMGFQWPPSYGASQGDRAGDFNTIFPITRTPDIQPGLGAMREDGRLRSFTAACGQTIFRGDRLGPDVQGDYFVCEPVGRIVRRAKVKSDKGKLILEHPYHEEEREFIASSDMLFRPVNSATGPDGCLYIVDMYRGIIQEGSWVRNGSFLRPVVQRMELDKRIRNGRIYRITHESLQPGPRPGMLGEKTPELIQHLSHPNGWWRDTAQKLIILRGDKSVIPLLKEVARNGADPLGRMHALWTLEGMAVLDKELLIEKYSDKDPRVRVASIRISEQVLPGDKTLLKELAKLKTDPDFEVPGQLLLSLAYSDEEEAENLALEIVTANPDNEAVNRARDMRRSAMEEAKRRRELAIRNQLLAELMEKGESIYMGLCITCHGPDGLGMPYDDRPKEIKGPPLKGSARVLGHKDVVTRIVLNGLTGPVDDKTYTEVMVPMQGIDDEILAATMTFVRNSWGNQATIIVEKDVARVKKEVGLREQPWTLVELEEFHPPELKNKPLWKATASHNSSTAHLAFDLKQETRYDTRESMKPGMWYQIEFPSKTKVSSIILNSERSRNDYPRGYEVQVSDDGKEWSEVLAKGSGQHPTTTIELPRIPSTFLRITQTGQASHWFWSIHELQVFGIAKKFVPEMKIPGEEKERAEDKELEELLENVEKIE
ncbi:MAG: ThuA domain-containing protein [Planctomycetota bacterium]|nr:ThuA domain-containing protein [Planctomycetota bacterium]MDA1137777.1 ThuA domain-containing protein [Planctomycetota bacterium]